MLLRGADPLTDSQRKMILEAEKSSARLAELAAELSEISKLDRRIADFKATQFDLFPALEKLASSVHEARDRDVHLKIRGEDVGARVSGDLSRIQTAFIAFSRAILREQPSDTTVVMDRRRVQAREGTSALVVIAAEATVAKVHASRTGPFLETQGGLGLALPIARRVIERHGGRVWSPTIDEIPSPKAILVSLPVLEPNQ
jgi:uncharacterized NAD(P)/FAD-binding protein YdhS